jgi:hypothetical protein
LVRDSKPLHRSDTVCGYVKGKNAAGRDTGEMPFLYIIDHNEAYLVDGNRPVAEIVHRSICDYEELSRALKPRGMFLIFTGERALPTLTE